MCCLEGELSDISMTVGLDRTACRDIEDNHKPGQARRDQTYWRLNGPRKVVGPGKIAPADHAKYQTKIRGVHVCYFGYSSQPTQVSVSECVSVLIHWIINLEVDLF